MKCDNCGHDNVDGARFCASCGNTLVVGELAAQHSLIGQVVGGRYRIVGLIGEGGMGVVYKAEQTLGSAVRPVAVKTLHAELSRDPAVTARFHREVGTVAQLEHPNTVKVYDFGSTEDGTLYIAMEYLDGHPLSRIIADEGALPYDRIGKIVHQIAGSLDEAHRGGIIHRDLKPENVLLVGRAGERDVVKLVDFGIAARAESADRAQEQKLTQQGMVLGTPPYMSPEQFTGKALDARSDIYSLGVMVYEMLTGSLPFEANTAWEWATAHMTSPPRDFTITDAGASVPAPVREVVLRALAKDPAKRQASAGEFDRELSDAFARKSTAAAAVDVSAATQAMPQAPSEVVMAPTEAMPAASPAPIAVPPAPPRTKARAEGGRGLIVGLGALGIGLLAAMAVVLMNGKRDPAGPTEPIASAPPPAETTVIEAEVPQEEASSAATEPEPPPPEPKPAATAKPASTAKPAATAAKPPAKPATPATPPATPPATTTPPAPTPPATTAPPAATPPVTTPTPPPATPPSTPATSSRDACAQCLVEVTRGDFDSAARSYGACSAEQEKSRCRARAAAAAPRAVQTAALNQDCARARAIASSAQQMGVPASRLTGPLASCR